MSTPKQFLQVEDFGKVTRYHHIYLLSMLKLSPWRCMQLKQQEELWELRFVNKLQA